MSRPKQELELVWFSNCTASRGWCVHVQAKISLTTHESVADVKMEIPVFDTITEVKHLELNQFSDG